MIHRVKAFNTATASSNKIHDDEVARQFGFRGGLVPGVDVYAYLCHLPAARWGARWLAGGTMTARFRSPVYDGDTVEIESTPDGDDGDEALDLSLRDPTGAECATGRATLSPGGTPADVDPGEWPSGPPPDERPDVSTAVLQEARFGSIAATFRAEHAPEYLDDVGETLPLFRDERPAHPGWLLRFVNSVLVANVALGPWIHTESQVQLLGVVGDGDRVETRARVADLHERRGHQLVDLDVLQLVGDRLVARVAHTAIYRIGTNTRRT